MPTKSYLGKTFGGSARPLDIRRVKTIVREAGGKQMILREEPEEEQG